MPGLAAGSPMIRFIDQVSTLTRPGPHGEDRAYVRGPRFAGRQLAPPGATSRWIGDLILERLRNRLVNLLNHGVQSGTVYRLTVGDPAS